MLLGPCDPVPSHNLFHPFTFCFSCVLFFSFAADQGAPAWHRAMGVLGLLLATGNTAAITTITSLRRNLKVKHWKVSSNMPTLFAHLRQLEAAGRIIQVHIPQSRIQPETRPGKASSSLALMHAMKHYAQITAHLMRRLQAAYLTCTKLDKQMWHLQLNSGEAKHALFGSSQAFRRLDTYLDDDLTKQQLLGRRSLGSKRLHLKQLNCKTWWRRDTLCWSDANGVHKQGPAGP